MGPKVQFTAVKVSYRHSFSSFHSYVPQHPQKLLACLDFTLN